MSRRKEICCSGTISPMLHETAGANTQEQQMQNKKLVANKTFIINIHYHLLSKATYLIQRRYTPIINVEHNCRGDLSYQSINR